MSVAHSLFEAMLFASIAPEASWRKRWPKLKGLIGRFLAELEAKSECSHLAVPAGVELERLVASACVADGNMTVGKTLALKLDISRRFQAPAPQLPVDRAWIGVFWDVEEIGALEAPVVAGQLCEYVIADAIAAKLAWEILGSFFQSSFYGSLTSRDAGDAVSYYRGDTFVGSVPANGSSAQLHDSIGWPSFLQELFGRPTWTGDDFYDSGKEEPIALEMGASRACSLEIGPPVPDIITDGDEVEIEFRVGGLPYARSLMKSRAGRIAASDIRVEMLVCGGFELCRAVVRETLLFQEGAGTLDERLVAARERHLARRKQPEPIEAGPLNRRGRATLLHNEHGHIGRNAAAAMSFSVVDSHVRWLLGARGDTPVSTISFRRFALPASAYGEVARREDKVSPLWQNPHVRFGIAGARSPELLPPDGSHHEVMAEQAPRSARLYDAYAWETHFAGRPDPWGYTNAYEKRKYEQTFSLLPEGNIAAALELACAEGHFTAQLAPRIGTLVAADISSLALERAAERCSLFDNVKFLKLDLLADAIPGVYDLIVCSEVLYYVLDEFALGETARKIASALAPDGTLIMAHANMLSDQPERGGFDWNLPFGALRIGQAFASVPGLQFVQELRTDLYRIQKFQKRKRPAGSQPEITTAAHAEPLPEKIRASFRGPYGKTIYTERIGNDSKTLPILMYHRVAEPASFLDAPYCTPPAAFESQIEYLHNAGFYSVSLDQWGAAAMRRKPLPGRPVIITFDDGYTDFATEAWPILKRFGFGAEVFLVTGAVGKVSHWDPPGFPVAPLMDWRQIAELHSQGVRFGAHTVSHLPLMACSPDQIVRELARSRFTIEDRLGSPVTAVAYPFGSQNGSCRHYAGGCGYSYGLTTKSGKAHLNGDLLDLPRMSAPTGSSLEGFLKTLDNR